VRGNLANLDLSQQAASAHWEKLRVSRSRSESCTT
jgi:hypothetical protein